MGIENNRKLIVNCLPLTPSEQAQFMRAAKGVLQEFVGDPAQRGNMAWTAIIPEELKAQVTAIIGNVDPGTCRQCPKLEWLQTWSAGVDKYQRPGILQSGSMLSGIHFDWSAHRDASQARICCSLTGLKSHASSPTFTLRGSVPSGTS